MAIDPPPNLVLTPMNGKGRPISAWLSMFHLVFVAVNPWNDRSRRIIETAGRIFETYDEADCRVAWLLAGGGPADAQRILGPWADEVLTFVDPDFEAIRAFGLTALPAIVHLGPDGSVHAAVEGWDPPAWRALTHELSRALSWTKPPIPWPTDPAPFEGAPVPA